MEVFHKVITVISGPEPNWKRIALYIAKNHPVMFLDAVADKVSAEEMAEDCLEQGLGTIDAVRAIRNSHKMCLRDAKEVVDMVYSPGLRDA